MMKIGVIADCQYADIPDLHQEGRTQRFRQVPQKLQDALENMGDCDFIIHLGDIIQSQECPIRTKEELETICSIFKSCLIPKIHVLGNHCIGTLPRAAVLETLQIPSPGYYAVELSSYWRCIVLDTTEMSGHSGYSQGSQQSKEADTYLKNHPLTDKDPHMVSWNGGITSSQMRWFCEQLDEAKENGLHVVICSHHQINPLAARRTHLAWNFQEISGVLSEYSSVIKLILAGHDHIGGGCRIVDSNGNTQVFITVPAVLEAPPGSNSYMIFELENLNNDSVNSKNGYESSACISVTGFGERSEKIAQNLFKHGTSQREFEHLLTG